MDFTILSNFLSNYSDRQLLELTLGFCVFAFTYFEIYFTYTLVDFIYRFIKFIRAKVIEKKLRKGSQS